MLLYFLEQLSTGIEVFLYYNMHVRVDYHCIYLRIMRFPFSHACCRHQIVYLQLT